MPFQRSEYMTLTARVGFVYSDMKTVVIIIIIIIIIIITLLQHLW